MIARIFSFLWMPEAQKNEVQVILDHDLGNWINQEVASVLTGHDLEKYAMEYFNDLKKKVISLRSQLSLWEERCNTVSKDKQESVSFFFVDAKQLLDFFNVERCSFYDVHALHQAFSSKLDRLLLKMEERDVVGLLKSFVGEEYLLAGSLVRALEELNDLTRSFDQKMKDSNFFAVHTLQQKVRQLQKNTDRVVRVQQRIQGKQQRLAMALQKKKEKEQQISTLLGQEKSGAWKEVEEKQAVLRSHIEKNTKEIVSFFSAFSSLFDEYAGVENSSKVFAYQEDPLNAFTEDEGLSIVHVLQHLEAMVQSKKIAVGEDTKEELLSLFDEARSGYLEHLQRDYFRLRRMEEQLTHSVRGRDFFRKKEELQYKFDHYKDQVARLEEEIPALEEELNQIEEVVNKEKEMVVNLTRLSLKRDITIVYARSSKKDVS